MPELEIHYCGEEWAALFVDGKLDTLGDSYLAEEKALCLLGVKTVGGPDGLDVLRGGDGRSVDGSPSPAITLDEVAAYRAERVRRQSLAAEKRAEAEALLAQAAELEAR